MKKLLVLCIIALGIAACGGGDKDDKKETTTPTSSTEENENPSYDPKRGAGKFTKVDVSPTLEVAKADAGEKVYSVKCGACHKLTQEKLVGPGWKNITGRHTAEWIMNFATNPDEMLNKDPKAQAMLEICLVRMPNQNLSDDDARNVYEFMRKNDGVK
ncbi:MAG: cytochrome c [Bacteroidetes bacterium]|jgi:cytochrome c551/c552|nr:MAG: cytochrome c [Bacteroidota bacterium]